MSVFFVSTLSSGSVSPPQLGANGLLMGFLGGFEGVVSLRHLPLPSQHSVSEGFPLRKKLRARLLWVDVGGKSLGLSLQKQVVSGTAYSFENVEIGEVFQGALLLLLCVVVVVVCL